jgi:small conductance mechanosensitive channel
MMSSPVTLTDLPGLLSHALHLAAILVIALICIRLLRSATNKLIKIASAQSKASQQREQQTRAVADNIYSTGSKLIWAGAVLTALPEFGITALPGLVITSAVILAFSIGARTTIRDVIAGLQIVTEDQFIAGDTIQIGDTIGRVEQLTLRRTVVRDGRGALVSLSNGEIRVVANLSRDWSQAFVDIGVAADIPVEKALRALESAAAQLRSDAAWSQALVDGPRVLGLQAYDYSGATLRLQVRTAPTRQDEVCRELRRRVQIELQRQDIAVAGAKSGGTDA